MLNLYQKAVVLAKTYDTPVWLVIYSPQGVTDKVKYLITAHLDIARKQKGTLVSIKVRPNESYLIEVGRRFIDPSIPTAGGNGNDSSIWYEKYAPDNMSPFEFMYIVQEKVKWKG